MLALVLVYQYWIALADIDGFRIDTFKHVTLEQARNFCNAIKEYAEILGKEDFFLVAEIAGGNATQDKYLDIAGRNLNACLDIGEQREIICSVGKGLEPATDFFAGFNFWNDDMGSHRNYGSQHLSISNDHDHVFGLKARLAADASNDHQSVATAAIQLFTLGIPCLYYGIEQGLAGGAESDQRQYLKNWGSTDSLLREAMFGPQHPLASGWTGAQGQTDSNMPGFGPHGTSGWHVFNPDHPIYKRIAKMAVIREKYKPLCRGRQYQREISYDSNPFSSLYIGHLIAWSRIFDDQEVLVIINSHGVDPKQGRIIADSRLSAKGMKIVLNTDPAAPAGLTEGTIVPLSSWENLRFIDMKTSTLAASEIIILANRSAIEEAGLTW
jgi:glycosidase